MDSEVLIVDRNIIRSLKQRRSDCSWDAFPFYQSKHGETRLDLLDFFSRSSDEGSTFYLTNGASTNCRWCFCYIGDMETLAMSCWDATVIMRQLTLSGHAVLQHRDEKLTSDFGVPSLIHFAACSLSPLS